MKPLVALFAAALGLAVVALILDSPALILVSIGLVVAVGVGVFAISVRTAQQADFVLPYVGTLAAALVVAAIAVAAIVFGERGNSPGLVLFGVVVITCVVVGAFALGMRSVQRGR